MAKSKNKKPSAWDIFCEFRSNGRTEVFAQWSVLWQTLEDSSVHFDLLEPIQHESGTQYQAMLIGLFCYAPASRPFILDMIKATGSQTNIINGVMESMKMAQPFQDEFMEHADVLFEWAISNGGAFGRIPGVRRQPKDAGQWVYDKACKYKGGKEGLIQQCSLGEICALSIFLTSDYGRLDLSACLNDIEDYREAEQLVYRWMKEEFGLWVAFPKAFKEVSTHAMYIERALYSYQDLAEIFTGGDIVKLVGLHAQASGEIIRNASKIALQLVLKEPRYWEILEGAERSLFTHWRRAGMLSDVEWMQLVETSDAQKEAFLMRDVGL